jgi:aminoglycoside phosphotransferase (APT) family kinase protein
VTVTRPSDLLESAARHGLLLTTDDPECDESGLDFVVVHAQDQSGTPWIVRRARRPNVIAAARIEARTLTLVGPRLPVSVPDWRLFSDELIAYPRLPGTPALSFDRVQGVRWNIIDPKNPPTTFLESLARALAALHATPLEDVRAAGLAVTSAEQERQSLAEMMAATRNMLAPADATWRRWNDWLEQHATWPDHRVLVHGDLHPGHWLLDDTGQLTGLLDWTAAQVGDPGSDFGLLHGSFGASVLRDLVDGYARAGGKTWPHLLAHSRERWAFFPVIAAHFAEQTNDTGVLTRARQLLAATESEAP